MNRFTAYDGDTRFVRVTKAKARRAYAMGKPVVLCPVKLMPFGGFRPSMMVQRDFHDEIERTAFGLNVMDFDYISDSFVSYNCYLNETGYYPSYWVQP
jgi:hypothetical protein